jgi:hypothetical protein
MGGLMGGVLVVMEISYLSQTENDVDKGSLPCNAITTVNAGMAVVLILSIHEVVTGSRSTK